MKRRRLKHPADVAHQDLVRGRTDGPAALRRCRRLHRRAHEGPEKEAKRRRAARIRIQTERVLPARAVGEERGVAVRHEHQRRRGLRPLDRAVQGAVD